MISVITGQNIHHGRQCNCTHDGSILAQRILDSHSVAKMRVGRNPNLIKDSRGDKGIGDNLAVTKATAQSTGLCLQLHLSGVTTLRRGLKCSGGDFVITVGTAYFLCNISHQVQVRTEGGDQNRITFHRDLQQIQILDHLFLGDIGTQQTIHLIYFQRQGLSFGNIVDHIDGAIQNIATAQHLNQFTGALDSRYGHHGIQMLFKFAGSIGTHTQSQCGLTDRGTVEVSRFEDNHSGVIHDFRVFTTHNACQTNSLAVISNDKHTLGQIADNTIQSGKCFAILCFTDNNLTGSHIAVVKCVHGLTVLQHNIIGNIHDVIDGTDTVCSQTLTHPLGRGANLYICDHTGGIAVAQSLSRHFHIQMVIDRAGIATLDNRLVMLHLHTKSSRRLPCQTDDRVAIGTVIGNFEVHNSVIIADDQIDIITGLTVLFIENPDAVCKHTGQIILSQAQFLKGAEHTVGLFTPELALGDMNTAGQPGVMQCSGNQITFVNILCAGNDLNQLFLAHIYLADKHMVRVGVGDHGNNLAYNHVLDFCIHALVGLNLLAEHSELLYIFFIGNMGKIHEILMQPFSVQFHIAFPP